jgi:hypothetical protein
MGKGGLRRLALVAITAAAGCGADIGDGGPESRPPDGAPRGADAAGIPDAAPPVDARPLCEGGDATAEGGDGTCFVYFATPATWDAARTACEGIGGTLAVIDDQAQNLLLSTIPPADPALPDIWAAGTDAGSEGEWHWLAGGTVFYSAGAVVTYAHWRSGEPNNSNGVENCLVVEGDTPIAGEGYTWDDRDCTRSYSYVCEK